MPVDPTLVERLARYGQGHLLRWWDELGPAERAALVAQGDAIDLAELAELTEATVLDFAEHESCGLGHARCLVRGQMPSVARTSGKALLAERGRVALSPGGRGGTLAALAAPGAGGAPSCLDGMRGRGIRTLFYF